LTVGENNESFFFVDVALGNRGAVLLLAADLFNRPVAVYGGDVLGAESLIDVWLIHIARSTVTYEGFLNRIIEVFINVFAWEDGEAFFIGLCFNRC
jgi:hypothetical protein